MFDASPVPQNPVAPLDASVPGTIISRPSQEMHVVLVDDNDAFRTAAAFALEKQGFKVRQFAQGESLMRVTSNVTEASIILLDWHLAERSGLVRLASELRRREFNTPVAFTSGQALVSNEKAALDTGAADFIDKTRGVDVLAKRVARIVNARSMAAPRERRWAHGGLALHPASHRSEWQGQDVGLTLTEYKVVALLAENLGKAVTYRAIYDGMHYVGFLGGFGDDGFLVNVRSAMKRIRRKYAKIDPAFSEIVNHPAIGYCWREQPAQNQPPARLVA